MECRTASVLAYQEVRVLGSGERESLAGGFLRPRALRGIFEQVVWRRTIVKGVCGFTASVGVKRERYIRLSSL